MKTLLLVLLAFSCNAQEGMTQSEIKFIHFDWGDDTERVISKWVIDSVYNAGNDKCIHSWVEKDIRDGMYKYGTCLVLHGATGCPDTWGHVMRICRHCLRKEETHEERTVEYIEVIDEFEELNKKIKQ